MPLMHGCAIVSCIVRHSGTLRMPTPSPEKLIALIYESVAEPCAWQPTFEQCMRAIGGHSGFMFAK